MSPKVKTGSQKKEEAKKFRGDISGLYLGSKDLGLILGMSVRRIPQLAEEGMPKSGKGNRISYHLVSCARWYVNHLKGKNKGKATRVLTEERQRLLSAQANKAEKEYEVLAKTLVPLEDIKHQVSEILMALRGEILGLPGRLAPDLAVISEPAKVRASLMEEFSRSLNNVADKLEKLIQ